MHCTACGAALTLAERAWDRGLCFRCITAGPPDRYAAARDALQRALATYYASPEYARLVAAYPEARRD